MISCDEVRGLLSALLDGELGERDAARVRRHLAGCTDCAELFEAMRAVIGAGSELAGLEPPQELREVVQASECSHWLTLLHRAADRELPTGALARLLEHLESCPSCRRAWDDLSLVHQVGAALEPPADLADRCAAVPFRARRRGRRVFGARTATAAAYFLAIVTTLVAGNPVTLARNEAGGMIRQARTAVHQSVKQLTTDGRGELRLMVWRVWRWGERQAAVLGRVIRGQEPPGKTGAQDKTTDKEGPDEH